MTIECRDEELRDLLPALAHGRLDASGRQRAEAHVASCAACAAELEIIRAARVAFARVPMVDTARIVAALPPAPLRPALRVERGGAQPPRRGWWATRSGALRIAAGIGAIAVGGVGLKIATDDGAPVNVVRVEEPARPTAPAVAPVAGPSRVASPGTVGSTVAGGMTFGGGVGDLSDDQLRALLADLDDLESVPSAEPEMELVPIGIGEG